MHLKEGGPTVPKGTSLTSRCHHGWLFLRAVRKNLFQASPLPFYGLLAMSGASWLEVTPSQSLPSVSHGLLPVCVSVSKCPLLIRTLVIFNLALLKWCDFTLIASVKTLSPNKVTFQATMSEDFNVWTWEGGHSTCTNQFWHFPIIQAGNKGNRINYR